MITSPNLFENIVPNKEYFPENRESVIYQLHCTKTNECPVKIWNFHSSQPIEFPPGSFIQGAVYSMVVLKMDFDESMASFVGYRIILNGGNPIPQYIPRNWNRNKTNRK
jgi:hypothetical protein